jgi:YD repeat-containing protein
MWVEQGDSLSGSAGNVGTHVFVSYAVEDRPTAERVVRALTGLGWQVWWDREIVPGKTFDERIADRLRNAGAVVVLWSRHSVSSEWVREEASDAKRRDVLIPAFIEHVEPPFGFKLRHAVDLTSWNGVPSAPEFSTLATAIRGLIPPLQERTSLPTTRTEEQGERRKIAWPVRPALLALAVLLAVGAVGGLWYWDAYHRVQLEHFANVTKRHGLPQGIDPLDPLQVARRNVSLALIRHGRRNPVDEVRLVNSSGNMPPPGTFVPPFSFWDLNPLPSSALDLNNPLRSELLTVTRVSFSRDAGGRILEQNGFTGAGRPVYTLHYGTQETGEYKTHGFTRSIRASGIAYVRFTRVQSGPNAGLDEKIMFLDAARQPQPDETGAYGYRFRFDDRGRIRESVVLGPHFEDGPNNYGLFKRVASHDPLGNLTDVSTFDRKGARVTDRSGAAVARMLYDAAGNPTRTTFYDRNGELVSPPNVGAASLSFTYDNGGGLTSATLLGPDQRPVIGRLGYARKTFDWLTPTRALNRFYDPNDRQVPVAGGAFEVIATWDARGLLIEEAYRDKKSEPTRINIGCSTVQLAHDAVGNATEVRCLNEERAATTSTEGFSIKRSTYDDRGNPLMTAFFDRENKPGIQGDFYTSVRREYNAFGKVSKETLLDASGNPRKGRLGYASVAYTYDRSGNLVQEAYLDEEGRPTVTVGGYAARRSEYDGRGLEIRRSFMAANGQLSRIDEGYVTIRNEYDDRGLLKAWTFLDEDGHPVKSINGYAQARIKRNARGQRLEIAYFDDRSVPVVSTRPGSASRRWTYDSWGRVIERSDYDTAGRPMTNAHGYSTLRYSYDEDGRETRRQLLDTSGRSLTFKVSVDNVDKASVAADAGFRVQDFILTYDGEPVATSYEFANRFELFKGDRHREIRVERGAQVIGLDLPPGRLTGLQLEEKAHP